MSRDLRYAVLARKNTAQLYMVHQHSSVFGFPFGILHAVTLHGEYEQPSMVLTTSTCKEGSSYIV